jgi:hypothetical protein
MLRARAHVGTSNIVGMYEGVRDGNLNERMSEMADASQNSDNMLVKGVSNLGAALGTAVGGNDNVLDMGKVRRLASLSRRDT